jgi:hypothetical protein
VSSSVARFVWLLFDFFNNIGKLVRGAWFLKQVSRFGDDQASIEAFVAKQCDKLDKQANKQAKIAHKLYVKQEKAAVAAAAAAAVVAPTMNDEQIGEVQRQFAANGVDVALVPRAAMQALKADAANGAFQQHVAALRARHHTVLMPAFLDRLAALDAEQRALLVAQKSAQLLRKQLKQRQQQV